MSIEERLENLSRKVSRNPNTSDLSLEVFFESDSYSFRYLSPGANPRHLIASTTKTFASVLLQKLVKENGLSLETKISAVLDPSEYNGLNVFRGTDYSESVSIKNLLAHTSGIPNYFSKKRIKAGKNYSEQTLKDPGWKFEETLEIARGIKAKFPPGNSRAEYSFTNYQLVGRVIEKLGGESFRNILNKQIVQPLNLKNTEVLTFENLELFDQIAPVVYGSFPYLGARRIASLGAEGAIVSTTSDVLRFSRALFSGELLDSSDILSMKEPNLLVKPGIRYGLGLMRMKIPIFHPRGIEGFGHLGATGHFMFYFPEIKMHVAGTTNQLKPGLLTTKLISDLVRKTG